MSDMSGHDATQRDDLHTMTLSELEARVAAAGVLISRRQLMRHCDVGTFEAKKLPSVNNVEQWFIAPASVDKGIADIKTLQEQRARRDASRPVMTGHDGLEYPELNGGDTSGHDATGRDATGHVAPEKLKNGNTDSSGHDRSRLDMSGLSEQETWSVTEPETQGRLALLEMQIEEKNKQLGDKDNQIEFLQDELKDRRDQIRGMKEIISEQKTLLETLVTPIFKALAKSVEIGSLSPGPVKTSSVDVRPSREAADPPMQ